MVLEFRRVLFRSSYVFFDDTLTTEDNRWRETTDFSELQDYRESYGDYANLVVFILEMEDGEVVSMKEQFVP